MSELYMLKRSLLFLVAPFVVGCAYRAPPAGDPVAELSIVGNSVDIEGGFNTITANILTPNCRLQSYITPVREQEVRTVQLAAGKQVILALGHSRVRKLPPTRRSGFFTCQDGASFVPESGRQYKALLDTDALKRETCRTVVLERASGSDDWKPLSASHLCSG